MEKNMEHEMETREYVGVILYPGSPIAITAGI